MSNRVIAPRSRIAGMEIQVFRNANSSQTNAYSHYSNYSYSGLIPNERALRRLWVIPGRIGVWKVITVEQIVILENRGRVLIYGESRFLLQFRRRTLKDDKVFRLFFRFPVDGYK